MNKYMGFFELKSLGVPSVKWEKFVPGTKLDPNLLWTVRMAVENSFDINLPRYVGVTSEEAEAAAEELFCKYQPGGLVIYYPFFLAEKSGVLKVSRGQTVIEAVAGDLWNLTTYGRADITLIYGANGPSPCGNPDPGYVYMGPEHLHRDPGLTNKDFFNGSELAQLHQAISVIKSRFRDELIEGKSILAEWSFAYNTDISRKPIGDKYLVFYELRSI